MSRKENIGFPSLGLDERVVEQAKALGFRRATEVQEQVIPLFLEKRNLIVEAPTGTGKTAAYGLPLISRLDLLKRTTYALVLLPSRELAQQVAAALQSFHDESLKVGVVYGGQSVEDAVAVIRKSPHILVAVPGMLRNVMGKDHYDYLWRDIKHLIVDEGDKLLESGFQNDFDEIRKHIRKTAHICFFSATISADAEKMVRERVELVTTIRIDPKRVFRNIRFVNIEAKGKRESILATLLETQDISKALIFCSRRQDIFAVTGFLRNCGFKAEAYHGTQEQGERANILNRFREGHIRYLVASDLAARGLDIESLPAIVNLNITKEYDFYLHRVGRTGRAGNKGTVYNLLTSNVEEVYVANHHKTMGIKPDSLELAPSSAAEFAHTRDSRWQKFHFSRGSKDKIRKGDIVGFLVYHAGLTGEEIGTITVYDTYSIVDMPEVAFENLAAHQELKIKNLTLKVRKVSVEEQERKAVAVKKLVTKRKIE